MRNRSHTIQQFASELRASLTPGEAALWCCIRGCRTGVWFRRQVVIGRYIVDLVAPSARLVVEWYGSQCTPR